MDDPPLRRHSSSLIPWSPFTGCSKGTRIYLVSDLRNFLSPWHHTCCLQLSWSRCEKNQKRWRATQVFPNGVRLFELGYCPSFPLIPPSAALCRPWQLPSIKGNEAQGAMLGYFCSSYLPLPSPLSPLCSNAHDGRASLSVRQVRNFLLPYPQLLSVLCPEDGGGSCSRHLLSVY